MESKSYYIVYLVKWRAVCDWIINDGPFAISYYANEQLIYWDRVKILYTLFKVTNNENQLAL